MNNNNAMKNVSCSQTMQSYVRHEASYVMMMIPQLCWVFVLKNTNTNAVETKNHSKILTNFIPNNVKTFTFSGVF